jgi:acyl-coenzyme A thioesterase PaaI-like protein
MTDADRLAGALRALLSTTVRTQAAPEALARATALVEQATATLQHDVRSEPSPMATMAFRHAFSIVTGTAHPMAPPVAFDVVDGEVRGRFRLDQQYEGGPGLAHGGILSLVFDHLLGEAALAADAGGMTVGLDVRYLAPTPLHADLDIACRVEAVEGRKVRLTGEISHAGTVTATARALFVQIDAAAAAKVFPHLTRA